MQTMTREQIESLADEAANQAIRHIQDKIGQPTGDFAGLYFSGDRWGVLVEILSAYIAAEISEGV